MTTPLYNRTSLTPEELGAALHRAHLERAKAVREMFAAAFAWARKVAVRRHADPALKTADCH